jgi:hypothetical protein
MLKKTVSSNPLFDHHHLGLILALHDLVIFAYILDVALYDLDRFAYIVPWIVCGDASWSLSRCHEGRII